MSVTALARSAATVVVVLAAPNASAIGDFCTSNGDCGLLGERCDTANQLCACAPGLTPCLGGPCTNTDVDIQHCGACGVVCDPGEICVSGTCVLSCPIGLTNCFGACVDHDTDESHCGACGQDCESNERCVSETCVVVGAPESQGTRIESGFTFNVSAASTTATPLLSEADSDGLQLAFYLELGGGGPNGGSLDVTFALEGFGGVAVDELELVAATVPTSAGESSYVAMVQGTPVSLGLAPGYYEVAVVWEVTDAFGERAATGFSADAVLVVFDDPTVP